MDQKIRFENTFRTIYLYPFALSLIVTGLVWQWILNPAFGLQKSIRELGWESFSFDLDRQPGDGRLHAGDRRRSGRAPAWSWR